MSSKFSLVWLAIYLGFGFATQMSWYEDMPIRSLFDGSAYFSTYAHILVWWLFPIIWLFEMIFWPLVACAVVSTMALTVAFACWAGNEYRRRKAFQAWRDAEPDDQER